MKCIFHVSALHVDTLKSILNHVDVIYDCKTVNSKIQNIYLVEVDNLLSSLVYKDYVRIIQDYLPDSNYEAASCDVPLSILIRMEYKEE